MCVFALDKPWISKIMNYRRSYSLGYFGGYEVVGGRGQLSWSRGKGRSKAQVLRNLAIYLHL